MKICSKCENVINEIEEFTVLRWSGRQNKVLYFCEKCSREQAKLGIKTESAEKINEAYGKVIKLDVARIKRHNKARKKKYSPEYLRGVDEWICPDNCEHRKRRGQKKGK